MARGGARPGAGRKKGVPNKRTQELQKQVEATGKTPLDVMLDAMREAYAQKKMALAVAYAEKAAPYVHAKLATTTLKNDEENPFNFVEIRRVIIDAREQFAEKLARISGNEPEQIAGPKAIEWEAGEAQGMR